MLCKPKNSDLNLGKIVLPDRTKTGIDTNIPILNSKMYPNG